MKTNLNRTKTVQFWSTSSILNPHVWPNEVKTRLLYLTRLKDVFIYHFMLTRYKTVVQSQRQEQRAIENKRRDQTP